MTENQMHDDNELDTSASTTNKAGIILEVSTIIAVLTNLFFAYIAQKRNGPVGPEQQGAIAFEVVFFPLFIILIFSISKKYRNMKSRFTIVFFSSIFMIFVKLSQISQ